MGFKSQQGQQICVFPKPSGLSLRPIQLPVKWALGVLYQGIKWPGCEVNHSPSSGDKVKREWSYKPAPPVCFQGMKRNDFLPLPLFHRYCPRIGN
jgi:hypothetical protein